MRWSFCISDLLVIFAVISVGASVVAADGSAAPENVNVTAAVPGGAALGELAAAVLRATGVRALSVLPPAECMTRADSRACRRAIIAELAASRLHVALLTVPAAAAPSAPLLRDAGLDELGDSTPPLRRVCYAAPPARSLLDLADENIAAHYSLKAIKKSTTTKESQLEQALTVQNKGSCNETVEYCATVLARDKSEAELLVSIALSYNLKVNVIPVSDFNITNSSINSHIFCDWAPEGIRLSSPFNALGPTPCRGDIEAKECAFESRRIQKLVNTRALAHSPSGLRSLARLYLNGGEFNELEALSLASGPTVAVRHFLQAHPARTVARQLRVAVLLPNATCRETYDAPALAAAAALAERDLEKQWSGVVRFKVEIYDDQCDAARAYQYLINALGNGDYGELSGVAGPACGAAYADVARQGPGLGMPVLAYTAQVPPAPPAAALTLLAAGDARAPADVLAALMQALGWRRLSALSEPATRPVLSAVGLKTEVVAHRELPADHSDYDPDIFTQWAERVARASGRIVFVCAEDARAVRAALCAGGDAGLTPTAGAVWILPATLPRTWLTPTSTDRCTAERLQEMIDGHLSVVPEWMLPWLDNIVVDTDNTQENGSSTIEAADEAWIKRWHTQCRYLGAKCTQASPHAALLYDSLKLWAAALSKALVSRPDTLDALHHPSLARELVMNASKTSYTGLTGDFEWASVGEETEGAAFARASPMVLLQWNEGKRHVVGRYSDGQLTLQKEFIHWRTPDGRIPDDGDEDCAIRPLANFLHSNCRTAFVTLGILSLGLVIIALASTALYCKRRAEREYRARLERALGLRSLLPKTVGLDRWEVPRERVVINRKLGVGAFGTVYGGHALLAEDRGWTAVAVKTLKAGASTEEKLDFLSEAEAMKRFEHKNIVKLLGVVTKTEPVCTVMEFMLYGDLKNYLLARRHLAVEAGADTDEQVSARRLTSMALDAARALSYLAQLRYVHRDVAARNCLVSARRVVKLADFGMTRLVFENDYYRFSRKGMLPVRWMAPESLALGVFSPASDVWSFGVLLYEIVTFGSLPFQGLSNSEVLERVKAGNTLDLPSGLKPQLEGLIRSCWQQDYKARPTASEVAAFLADSPRLLSPCLDVPLDALPLDAEPPWRLPRERAEARWVSWAAPASADTDTTYLSAEGPRETDQFLP
ncbi:uncharacterized protein LOC121728746 [Aricia agestis]|uniref:uncharacterized protein LOC121728746 n=1 Tax=Aricia agestis TaxID=91739 RepID=UPI001C20A32A|nr:uncharacterized protein LOC121728746 [Aricia agestis]